MAELSNSDVDAIRKVIKDGGSYKLILRAEDVGLSEPVEANLIQKGLIDTGFQLPPSSLIYDDQTGADILRYTEGWTHVTVHIYRFGGEITYRRLPDGSFETTVTK